jgi:hypothetical protein
MALAGLEFGPVTPLPRAAQRGALGARVVGQRGHRRGDAHLAVELDQVRQVDSGARQRVVAAVGVLDVGHRDRVLEAIVDGGVGHLGAASLDHVGRRLAPDPGVGHGERVFLRVLEILEFLLPNAHAGQHLVGDHGLVAVGDGQRGEVGVDGERCVGHAGAPSVRVRVSPAGTAGRRGFPRHRQQPWPPRPQRRRCRCWCRRTGPQRLHARMSRT